MADLQDMLLFERYYGEANEITEWIALPRNNPFDKLWWQEIPWTFRLSKIAVKKLLEQFQQLYNVIILPQNEFDRFFCKQ